MPAITLRECPPKIANYYDADDKVSRVSASTTRDGAEQYIVTHAFGKDTWRYVNHEWSLIKTS